jgi:hypothetical protein
VSAKKKQKTNIAANKLSPQRKQVAGWKLPPAAIAELVADLSYEDEKSAQADRTAKISKTKLAGGISKRRLSTNEIIGNSLGVILASK